MKARINEIFYSIQGEGRNAGKPSIFIRFQGCQLRCPWCDTSGALDKNKGKEMDTAEITSSIKGYPCKHVVITGGDPSMQPLALGELAGTLSRKGYTLEMETSGFSLIDVKTCQLFQQLNIGLKLPEPQQELKESYYQEAARHYLQFPQVDFKIVVDCRKDAEFIHNKIEKALKVPPERIFLMPQGADVMEQAKNSDLVIELCKEMGYMFSPRLHIIHGVR